MTKRIHTFAGALLATVLLAGCGGDDEAKTNANAPADRAVKIVRVLAEGSQSAFGGKRDVAVVAGVQGKYEEIQRRHARGRDKADPDPWPDVDFVNSDVVAVFLRPGGGGEKVRIESVTLKDGSLNVFAVLTRPGPGCLRTAVVTHPYVVVETEKVSRLPALVVQREQGPPC